MTPIRRTAIRISHAAIRWTSPAGRIWAEGLAHEIECIEGDWRALRWSLGSLRVALEGRLRQPKADGEATPASRFWWTWRLYFVWFFASRGWDGATRALSTLNWHDRIASSLLALGWICWAAESILNFWDSREPSLGSDAYLAFRRACLERRLKRYRTPLRWIPRLIPLCLCAGYSLSYSLHNSFLDALALLVGFVLIHIQWKATSPSSIEADMERVDKQIVARTAGVRVTSLRLPHQLLPPLLRTGRRRTRQLLTLRDRHYY